MSANTTSVASLRSAENEVTVMVPVLAVRMPRGSTPTSSERPVGSRVRPSCSVTVPSAAATTIADPSAVKATAPRLATPRPGHLLEQFAVGNVPQTQHAVDAHGHEASAVGAVVAPDRAEWERWLQLDLFAATEVDQVVRWPRQGDAAGRRADPDDAQESRRHRSSTTTRPTPPAPSMSQSMIHPSAADVYKDRHRR